MTITSKRILCVGKIVDGPIDWRIAPLPVDEADAAFDAPSECSYFAHLMPVDGTLQDIMDIANADILAEEWQEFWQDQAWMNTGLS
jgi:hypothetical protein